MFVIARSCAPALLPWRTKLKKVAFVGGRCDLGRVVLGLTLVSCFSAAKTRVKPSQNEGSVCGRPVRVVLGLTLVSCFFAAKTGDGTGQVTLECA